jgi:N-acetylmuramoyl-L-alanine amidase
VDRSRWAAEVKRPDWYLRLAGEYEALLAQARESPRALAQAIAHDVYSFFEDALENNMIALGTSGPEWDAERAPIDTAVIHHTNLEPGIDWRRIDAIHLTRIYARYYREPVPAEAAIRGKPIYSGHFRSERQLFVCYHWLIRQDGSRERLLEDDETGWHAGDWDVNCRSVGICFDGRFDGEQPAPEMTNAAARLLHDHYPHVSASRILGHREVNPTTTCPGDRFLDSWKEAITGSMG